MHKLRHHTYSRTCALMFLALALGPGLATAQTQQGRAALTTGIAYTSQWDDETHLGRGVLLSVGLAKLVTDKVRLEGEVSFARHERDAGFLAATGTPVVGTARASWLFGSPGSTARLFVSAGPMLTHSRGELRFSSSVPGDDGRPVPGPVEVRNWRVTKPGFEFGLGVEVRGKGRTWWRPEVRFSGTTGNHNYEPGVDALEIPIIAIRAGVTILW